MRIEFLEDFDTFENHYYQGDIIDVYEDEDINSDCYLYSFYTDFNENTIDHIPKNIVKVVK